MRCTTAVGPARLLRIRTGPWTVLECQSAPPRITRRSSRRGKAESQSECCFRPANASYAAHNVAAVAIPSNQPPAASLIQWRSR